MIHPVVASIIRTGVPILMGTLLSLLARINFDLDTEGQEALTTWLTSLFIGAYYLVVRLIEQKVPAVGWLLGLAKSPDSYSATPAGAHVAGPGDARK